MPSPVGHAIGGVVAGLILARPDRRGAWGVGLGQLGALALVGCLPDLDFLWGRHNAETHCLGGSVLAGAAVLAWTKGRQPRLALAVTLAWSTHVLFDWLGADDTPPLGVMALWPATDAYYFAHAYVFDAISRRYWLPGFLQHNVMAVGREVLLLAPVALIVAAIRRRLGHR